MSAAAVGPVGERDRIAELDVLRGLALFGVLAINLNGVAGPGFGMTEAQAAALQTAPLDYYVNWIVRLLMLDKANTVFATLFGLGFYLQMQRGMGRPGFEGRYARRLSWLLLFGILNMFLLWPWDILHLYAIAGLFLFAMRRWSTRALVIFGVAAALYSDKLHEWVVETLALPLPNSDSFTTDAGILQRQEVMNSGDYPAIVAHWAGFTWYDWVGSTMMLAFVVYALGRFALGAAIGRSGILEDVERFVPLLRKITWIGIAAGLAFGALIRLMFTGAIVEEDTVKMIGNALRSPAALVLAAGYCAGVVLALRKAWGRRLFGPFGAVGRMALTNYLAQGLICAFVLTGVGPGLALDGKIGSFAVLLICIAFFAFQMVYSHWWLARFRFGPMEWLWRALTYGERPRFRIVGSQPAEAL
jgi:uncharacterized protein